MPEDDLLLGGGFIAGDDAGDDSLLGRMPGDDSLLGGGFVAGGCQGTIRCWGRFVANTPRTQT
jgi:hypothetical protein